jgi:transposase
VWRKRLTRHAFMPFLAQLPPLRIGIEACGGAHDWARRFRAHGHDIKLLAHQFVKPFVKSNKNDRRAAEAIVEAVTRPTMRFVPI